MKYLAAPIMAVSSNSCAGISPRTKIYYFLLPICNDKLLSTPKIIAFLLQSKFGNEKSKWELDLVPYTE